MKEEIKLIAKQKRYNFWEQYYRPFAESCPICEKGKLSVGFRYSPSEYEVSCDNDDCHYKQEKTIEKED